MCAGSGPEKWGCSLQELKITQRQLRTLVVCGAENMCEAPPQASTVLGRQSVLISALLSSLGSTG